jgi:tRNA(adenine34) deaminase
MHGVNHEKWMNIALDLARKAESMDEVPIGALVICNEEIVGSGFNRRETDRAPLAHAEVLAIQEAAQKLGRWRLHDCTLYVTLEPCLMCSGAIVNSRVDTVVFGALDPKAGAVVSLYQTLGDLRLNHRPQVVSGVLAEACGSLLTEFFRRKR